LRLKKIYRKYLCEGLRIKASFSTKPGDLGLINQVERPFERGRHISFGFGIRHLKQKFFPYLKQKSMIMRNLGFRKSADLQRIEPMHCGDLWRFVAIVWVALGSFNLNAQTAIGGNTPHSSAMLDVQSTNKGVLFPRMTTTQRNAISPAATGLMIFNTTTGCLEINLGAGSAAWQSITCARRGLVETLNLSGRTFNNFPIDVMAGATNQSITIPYTGGNGSDYDSQTIPSTGITGLTATLAAGNFAVGAGSVTYNLSGTPSGSGTAVFPITLGGQSATLEVPLCGALVGVADFKVFSCYNLGAAGAAANVNPFSPDWQLNGDYYQWGYAGKAAPGPADATTPNEGNSSTFPADYTWNSTAAADDAWLDASKTANDPCPAGFRVPTEAQWQAVINTSNNTNSNIGTWPSGFTNFDSGKLIGDLLFLPATGLRVFNALFPNSDGNLQNRNASANYWSSTSSGSTNGRYLRLLSGSLGTNGSSRLDGFAVRCIAE